MRAAAFAEEFADEGRERAESQTFWNGFFEIFGRRRRGVARFEHAAKKLDGNTGAIDLFWPGKLLVEQKSVGRSLAEAREQAFGYFHGLKEAELPRYLLVSDFQSFALYDLDADTELKFTLAELPDHIERFGFIIGVERREFRDQDPVNIKASELVGALHNALQESGYTGIDLEKFLVRIVFCMFADDTGIFDTRDSFLDYLEGRTGEDGSDLGAKLSLLFQTLDTPLAERSAALDEDLAQFSYINGDLFKETIRIPSFDSAMREKLLDACRFDWSEISPAIFGALFQSVMEPAERRAQGAHYTTEMNILKVIEPLFMDDLRAEFEKIRVRRDSRREGALQAFHVKLGTMTFFDPACGCGNFLILTYREIRLLEIEVLKEIRKHRDDDRTRELDIAALCVVDVDQFFGIELGEFPAKIAETALWMMDHFMNNRLSLEFGQSFVRIPLEKSPHILCADALETDWAALLPAAECSFIIGNPPFIGSKYQSTEQRGQVRRIAALGGSGGTLDYVAAWFIKAAQYAHSAPVGIGFVATNSLTQGEQVAQLWPVLFGRYDLEIVFAHRTFQWGSDAKGKAQVHVVIIGLERTDTARAQRRLFSYESAQADPHESLHTVITPYLFDGSRLADPHLVVQETGTAMNGLSLLTVGSQPIDDGNYIFTVSERAEFVDLEPAAEKFLRPYVGAREFLQGSTRWILALQNATPTELRGLPQVVTRMNAVKAFRSGSKRKSTLAIKDYPQQYNLEVIPNDPFLVIPRVSSERREWIPVGWMKPPTIPSDAVLVLVGASKFHFSILSSAMHMSWLRHIGGRLKSDYRYSVGLVYNPFPMPRVSRAQNKRIEALVEAVLDARAAHAEASLADLYDPRVMPSPLLKAHRDLDAAVDRLYKRSGFASDRERVEHLFGLYEKSR